MKPADVLDFVQDCINEAEAGGYQQQEGSVVHVYGVSYGFVAHNEMWIKVGGEEFRLSIRKHSGRGKRK